jgi:threonine dehydratase
MMALQAPSLDEIRAAARRIAGAALRTPLARLNSESDVQIYLKLENLQPIGSFKLRGAANAIALTSRQQLADGVWTASAGNMAQGVAWNARRLGLSCTVVVPTNAPETKLAAIARLGAKIIKVPYDDWWQILVSHRFEGLRGRFIHPVSDPAVMAGNGTVGLEILEDLPEVESIVVPYGGGGLSVGIAASLLGSKRSTKVYAAEVETAAPLAASWAFDQPRPAPYLPSFVDGIGGKSVLEEIWPLAKTMLAGSIVVSLRAVADAIRMLVERNRVVAEGAGAASVAAALTGKAGTRHIVCVVSGGNLDTSKLTKILSGEIP